MNKWVVALLIGLSVFSSHAQNKPNSFQWNEEEYVQHMKRSINQMRADLKDTPEDSTYFAQVEEYFNTRPVDFGQFKRLHDQVYAELDQEAAAPIQREYQARQGNLKRVGFQGHGFYPFCSEVISLYEKQQTEVLRSQGKVNPSYKTDWAAINQSQLAQQSLNPEGIELETVQFADRVREANLTHVALACFGGNTTIKMLMRNKQVEISDLERRTIANATMFGDVFKVPTIYSSDLTKVPFMLAEIPMNKIETIYMDAHVPYVLSSTIEVIPDPAFQMDCWSEMSDLKKGKIEEEDYLNHIEVVAPVTRILHVTPAHRFYVCSEKNGKYGCGWERAENLKRGMSFYGSPTERYAFTAMTHFPIDGNEEFGIDKYRQVYNLSTETFTYYVGPNEGQVLVHNIK